MTLAPTKMAQTSLTTKDSVSNVKGAVTQKFLTMFPERPSGVSWADWVDDDDEDDDINVEGQYRTEAAAKVSEPKKETSSPPPPPARLSPPPPSSPPKAVGVASKPPRTRTRTRTRTRNHDKSPSPRRPAVVASRPTPSRKDEQSDNRIESHHQRISFDTAVPTPILLNPSMKPNERGLGASRWASAEPEETDTMATATATVTDKVTEPETSPEARRPASPATPPEPAEPITPATTPAAATTTRPQIVANTPSPKPKKGIAHPDVMMTTSPVAAAAATAATADAADKPIMASPESPKKKAGEPGLMASRWAN